jgi:alpha-glucoside transport system permease protein
VGLVGFLGPTLVVVGFFLVYPIVFSSICSFQDRSCDSFIGVDNYRRIFTDPQTFTAVKNNVIWVVVAPAVVTALGLVFAVLTERVRWATAFKVAIFMPMAISFLATGVIWRLVYDEQPSKGLLNAGLQGIAKVFDAPGEYAGARPSDERALPPEGKAYITAERFSVGDTATLGLVAITPQEVPPEAETAAQPPEPAGDAITGTVWLDFTLGGGGTSGQVDSREKGLPGVSVEAVRDGAVAAEATSGPDGTFTIEGLQGQGYQLRLAASNFQPPFGGFTWLGSSLVTPSIIVAYIWMWAGFAMIVIGAGLAAIPRDVLEAARVDGASEWQVFRRVTVPLLAPVLAVVLVTLAINVLKIFDLVLVMTAGTASAASADVIALRMWKAAFGGARDFGLGSALAIFLFLLVVPAMLFNIRRFRAEQR